LLTSVSKVTNIIQTEPAPAIIVNGAARATLRRERKARWATNAQTAAAKNINKIYGSRSKLIIIAHNAPIAFLYHIFFN
jgi:hypothetical protein